MTTATMRPETRIQVRDPRESMRVVPRVLQPFLTFVTGVPLQGARQLVCWSPNKACVLGIAQMAGGIAAGAWLLSQLTVWTAPLLVLALLITTGGLRRLDVVVVHQTLHRMFTRSALGNRIIGEVITTVFWRTPYDENRKEHLLHHQFPCSMKDVDTRYLLSTGMRPGMSPREFRRFIVLSLLSPAHHWRFFSGRIRSNLFGVRPRYRLIMSLVYLAATAAFLVLTGWWLQWVVLWLIPVSVLFQGATYLYTQTEHRWWLFANSEKLTKAQRDLLTFGRLCGETAPLPNAGWRPWTRWWARMVFVHLPYRMFVLVGDTVQHDLHHIRPGCDWANSPFVRRDDIAGGSDRYTDVWGSLTSHLYEAGMVSLQDGNERRA